MPDPMFSTIEVLNPTEPETRPAGPGAEGPPRLDSLRSARIGLLWNGKPNGDVALRAVQEAIDTRDLGAKFQFYSGSLPCDPELIKSVATQCDAVIAATADCGGCTTWLTHDCVQLENAGLPTVILASAGFERDVLLSSRAFGSLGVPCAAAKQVYNNLAPDSARTQTLAIVDAVIDRLTSKQPPTGSAGDEPTDSLEDPRELLSFHGSSELDAFTEFNEYLLERDWGDGYPLLPPSERVVDQILAGRRPDEVVCQLPPSNCQATMARIAVNAAMAGCRPEELPVVVTALKAIANAPRTATRIALMSTSAHAPFLLVNGPIARRLGINGKRCCLGPGRQNAANMRIGRSVLLCLKNIGGWYPGQADMDSIGSLRKNIGVIAENEDDSPWEPYHVSNGGLQAGDSAVTVFFTTGEWDIGFQGHLDGEQLAKSISALSAGNSSVGYFSGMQGGLTREEKRCPLGRLLLMPPPHAHPLSEEGFSKQGLEMFLFSHGRETVERLIEPNWKLYHDGNVRPEWRWLFELSPEQRVQMTLPVIERPDQYHVVVAGAVRGKDLLMPLRAEPHTEKVIDA